MEWLLSKMKLGKSNVQGTREQSLHSASSSGYVNSGHRAATKGTNSGNQAT